MSETLVEKAHRLIIEHRVVLNADGTATVFGDTGRHLVVNTPIAVRCSCRGWRPDRVCSHQLVAMNAWEEAEQKETA